MEIVFEFLYMLLLDGCFEIISSKKVNIIIRKIVLTFVTLFYAILITGFIIFIVKVQGVAVKMLFVIATTLILALLIKLWFKVFRNRLN